MRLFKFLDDIRELKKRAENLEERLRFLDRELTRHDTYINQDYKELLERANNLEAEIKTYDIQLNRIDSAIESLAERIDYLEQRVDVDKALAEGIDALMTYNPYDHVKGV